MIGNTKFYLEQFQIESSKRLKILIAKFLDRKTIIEWRSPEGKLISVAFLNRLDRKQLAHLFLSDYLKVSSIEELEKKGFELESSLTWEQFTLDIERHIDLKIPLHYWGYLHQTRRLSKSVARRQYAGIEHLNGMIFTYRLNYILDMRYIEKLEDSKRTEATMSQLNYLKNLAQKSGLELKRRKYQRDEIEDLIEDLTENQLTTEQRQQYFRAQDAYYSQALIKETEHYA